MALVDQRVIEKSIDKHLTKKADPFEQRTVRLSSVGCHSFTSQWLVSYTNHVCKHSSSKSTRKELHFNHLEGKGLFNARASHCAAQNQTFANTGKSATQHSESEALPHNQCDSSMNHADGRCLLTELLCVGDAPRVPGWDRGRAALGVGESWCEIHQAAPQI